jgi:hypothetical protein
MTDAKLLADIKKQVEFYFSDSAYRRDNFLRTAISGSADGFCPIKTLLTFNKLKNLTTDAAVVAEAVKDSQSVSLNDDKTGIKRAEPLPDVDDSANRTLYAKGFPTDDADVTLESVTNLFAPFGKLNYVKLRRDMSGGLKGSVFVEFSTEAELQAALDGSIKDGAIVLSWKDKPLVEVSTYNDWHLAKSEHRQSALGKRKGDKKGAEPVVKKEAAYEPGLLLRLKNIQSEDKNGRALRTFLQNHAEVGYCEFNDEGVTVRLYNADAVANLKKAVDAGLSYPEESETKISYEAIGEEEEKAFYQRLKESNQNSNNKGGRGGFHNKRQRR